jgi:hypothetical protein
MENQKLTFDQGIEVELDADVAAKRLASDDMHGMRTGCLSVPERTPTMR